MTEQEDRRTESAGPPTMVMQAYETLSEPKKRRMQKLGIALMIVGFGFPLVAGLFRELATAYWLFSSGIGFVGAAMYWPPIGIWAANAIPAALSRLIPSKAVASALRPDRRSRDES